MSVNFDPNRFHVTGAPYYPNEWVDETPFFPELSAFFGQADNRFREVGAHGLLPGQSAVVYSSAQTESIVDDPAMDIDLNADVPSSPHVNESTENVKYCTFCGTKATNRWDKGPQNNTLCNAHYAAFTRHLKRNRAEAQLKFAPQIHTLNQANEKQREAQMKTTEKIAFLKKPYCQVCANVSSYRWTTPEGFGTMCGTCYKRFHKVKTNSEQAKIDFAPKYFSYEAADAVGKNRGAELKEQQEKSKWRFCEHCGKTEETRWHKGVSKEGWLCNAHGQKLRSLKESNPKKVAEEFKPKFFSYEEALQEEIALLGKVIDDLEKEDT